MRYKIIRWTRQLRIWLGGRKQMEEKHYMFTLPRPLTPEEIWGRLWKHGWGYNTISHAFGGQIFTARKLVPPRHQFHLRFYKNGDVSGHFEVDPVQFLLEHTDGVDLRALTPEERGEIRSILP
ncbi:hypothetical protein LCGC14_0263560 [marine sediment metagenome]|uniref:DUF4132 domain-containing protein n=1 Tax=marine sediment metagenome TaxID=412755 RepID=A0A0F9WM00_9ZZZZ